jgi:hypothetical protein
MIFAEYQSHGSDLELPEFGQDRWNAEWNGYAAILADTFGQGRVLLSGPHPEFPSEGGKYQKPRLIGAMVKWAFRDDAVLPHIIGRDDRMPVMRVESGLKAMSARVTADTVVSSLSIYVAEGDGRGMLGIYIGDGDGRPGVLLAAGAPIELSPGSGGRWYTTALRRRVRILRDSTVWLAWLFERPVALAMDSSANGGGLGSTRIESTGLGWRDLSDNSLPRVFPDKTLADNKIAAVYALGTSPEQP